MHHAQRYTASSTPLTNEPSTRFLFRYCFSDCRLPTADCRPPTIAGIKIIQTGAKLMAAVTSLSASSMLPSLALQNPLRHIGLRKFILPKYIQNATRVKSARLHLGLKESLFHQRFVVLAVTEGSAESSQSDEKIPSWAKLGSVEPPPWALDESNASTSQLSIEIPYFTYLLASAITAIAAIGSIFEYINQRPVFGVLNSDSLFYVPVLGFFAFTGIPTSVLLWFKSVQVANKQGEEQDKRDGYL